MTVAIAVIAVFVCSGLVIWARTIERRYPNASDLIEFLAVLGQAVSVMYIGAKIGPALGIS